MRRFRLCPAIQGALLLFLIGARTATADSVQLVSRVDPGLRSATASGGSMTHGISSSISSDGRYLAFVSSARNLIAGQIDSELDGTVDVFLHDRVAGTTVLVSRSAASAVQTGNASSSSPMISSDGRYIAFLSEATDLVPGQKDTNNYSDVFLFDRLAGTTVLVSRWAGAAATTGDGRASSPAISADGSWIAFVSEATNLLAGQNDTNGYADVFLFSRAAGTVSLVSHAFSSPTTTGNRQSFSPTLSADGSRIAYVSAATNLVGGQTEANSDHDAFLYDRATAGTVLVSRIPASPTTTGNRGSEEAVISADGSYVAFSSLAWNLIPGQNGPSTRNIFLYRCSDGVVTLASRSAAGGNRSGNDLSYSPVVSASGDYVVFVSSAGDLIFDQGYSYYYRHIYLYHRATGLITLLSHADGQPVQVADGDSGSPWISADGGQIAFYSDASDLLPGVWGRNVYLFGRVSGILSLVSRPAAPTILNGESGIPVLSADGNYVAFSSAASNLVDRDFNEAWDVFLYQRTTATNTVVSRHAPGAPSLTPSRSSDDPSLSADGSYVVLRSLAQNLAPGQAGNDYQTDIYLYSRLTDAMTLVSRSAASPNTSAEGSSGYPEISADGDWILFASGASDLVPGQTQPGSSLVLYERTTGNRRLVTHTLGSPSTPDSGSLWEGGVLSADGRYAAYSGSFTNLVPGQDQDFFFKVFLYDRITDSTTLVSHSAASPVSSPHGDSFLPSISADGRFVVFQSEATNLIAGLADTNDGSDVFLYDRDTGAVTLISHAAGSAATAGDNTSSEPKISEDGRWIVFRSTASNLIAGQTDEPWSHDLFLYDRVTGTTTLATHRLGSSTTTADDGSEGSIEISAAGRFVVYASHAGDLTPGPIDQQAWMNIFLYDRTTGGNTLVSHSFASPNASGNYISPSAKISADGRYVAFTSQAWDLIAPGLDVNYDFPDAFLYDRLTGGIELISRTDGSPEAATGRAGALSADGGQTLILTAAPLVAGDLNQLVDVYLFNKDLPGTDFFTLTPCRLLDTRQPADGPAFASGVREILVPRGSCGIPETARALVLNVTVTQATGAGFVALHPGNSGTPASSTINFSPGSTRSNNVTMRLSTDGNGTLAVTPVVAGGGTVHVILDVTGYFE